jgi:hypothetical protein
MLAVDQAPVQLHIKDAAGTGSQLDVGEAFPPQQIRQTGGAGQVVSNLAVGDADGHANSL